MSQLSAPTGARVEILQTRGLDPAVADLATRQHGVVARRQLVRLELSDDAIAHRLATGRLHRVHSGVYAVGHRALSPSGGWMAAVLAGGEGAVLSYASAAALWGLIPASPTAVEITIPRSSRSTRQLRRHCSLLAPDETASRDGIPVTCVARTLFDIAARSSKRNFERAVREAEFLRLRQVPSLEEIHRRHPRRRGARLVRQTLEGLSRFRGETRSPLEDRFLPMVEQAGLPAPETNVSMRFGAAAYVADCVWHDAGVVVELDGHQAHGTRSAFESDRERDRRMQAIGWTVIRVTWRQLNHPRTLLTDLRHLLSRHEPASARPQAL